MAVTKRHLESGPSKMFGKNRGAALWQGSAASSASSGDRELCKFCCRLDCGASPQASPYGRNLPTSQGTSGGRTVSLIVV